MSPFPDSAPSAAPDARRRERGFLLAMVLAMATITGIMVSKAFPAHYTEVRREMEAELIFRGEAIARAIRVYQQKTGTYPTSLSDLEKLRPRIIRRIYRDPMTPSGEWDLVTAVQAGPSGETRGLPIVGVRSRSDKDSFKIYRGKTLYSDWVFSATDNLLTVPGAPPLAPGTSTSGEKGGDKGGGTDPRPPADKP